jgi:ABC-2 type transport system permease protein
MSAATRTLSFFTTWIAEFMRQPLLIATLLAGPFVILLCFGSSIDVSGRKPEVIVVRSGGEGDAIQPLPEELNDYVKVVGETTDLTAAIEELQDGDADAVAVIPPEPAGTITSGERIPVQMFTSEIDPITEEFTEAYLSDQVGRLNQRTLEEAIREAQASVGDVEAYVEDARGYVQLARSAGGDIDTIREQVDNVQEVLAPLTAATAAVVRATSGISFVLPGIGRPNDELEAFQQQVAELNEAVLSLDRRLGSGEDGAIPAEAELAQLEADLDDISARAQELQSIPPEVLSAPFELRLENVAPFDPDFTGFFSPAVLVLLIQHLGISLAALSLARIRVLGLMNLLRVAPIRAVEIVNGQYLSYGLVIAVIGAGVLALMYYALDVPIFGSLTTLVGTVLLLVAVSLGIGFVFSLLTSSEQQASQLAMLVLLAAVFFSGLVVSLERLAWPVKAISFALPSTYATRTSQDVMLRGVLRHPEDLAVLAVAAVVLYVLTVVLLRRRLQPV